MFFALPIRVKDPSDANVVPAANALLIVANVLVFWLGWSERWMVGPGTGLWSIVGYAFAHANAWHLISNMWILLVFGNPLNRRLGNEYYLVLYLGTAVALGLFARLFCDGYLLGASGAIFGVIAAFVILMPSLRVDVFYFTLFPLSLLVGLILRPKQWVHWFIRWDHFECRAIWGIFLVPLLELWGLYWVGLNWTNMGHLFGVLCGVIGVLMLPDSITMRRRSAYGV